MCFTSQSVNIKKDDTEIILDDEDLTSGRPVLNSRGAGSNIASGNNKREVVVKWVNENPESRFNDRTEAEILILVTIYQSQFIFVNIVHC